MANFFHTNLAHLRGAKGETQTETATALGINRSTYANYEVANNIPKWDILLKLTAHFKVSFETLVYLDLRQIRLLPGEPLLQYNFQEQPLLQQAEETQARIIHNSPLVITKDTKDRDVIAFVSNKMREDYISNFCDALFIRKLPMYAMPGLPKGRFRAFEVKGIAMFSSLRPGDIVVGQWATPEEFETDDVYVFVTEQHGILICRCNCLEDGSVQACYDNDNVLYPDTILDPDEILEAWHVQMRWTRHLSEAGGLFKRVSDMEQKLEQLRQDVRKAAK